MLSNTELHFLAAGLFGLATIGALVVSGFPYALTGLFGASALLNLALGMKSMRAGKHAGNSK